MCASESLVDGIIPEITGPPSRSIVFGNGSVATHSSTDVYESFGLRFRRSLTQLYSLPPQTTGDVRLLIQGRQYLSQTQAVRKLDPVTIAAVLRTPNAWVDRVKVRVAYQVKDVHGSSVVLRPTKVTMTMAAPSTGLTARTVTCEYHSQSMYNVDYCSVTYLPLGWFSAHAQASSTTVSLFENANPSAIADMVSIGELSLNAKPSWWDAGLRTATVGNGLSAPAGLSSNGGVIISLPASPVYAGERFFAYMYAHTSGVSLSAWRVRLYFSSSYLQYSSFSQNTQFNSASSSISTGEVSWLATGIKATTSNAEVTGSAIFLLRIELSFFSSVAAGAYNGDDIGLYPSATELISGGTFAQDVDGQIVDGRDGVQSRGQLEVAALPTTAGIFASSPGGVLANLAPLTGLQTSYELTIVRVSDDDRIQSDSNKVSVGVVCTSNELSAVLSLAGCSVVLGASQSASKSGASVAVSYAGSSAMAVFDVYSPRSTSLSLSDSILNRFVDSQNGSITACSFGGVTAYPYQRTRAVAFADGLDTTALVTFVAADESVAGVSGTDFDVIEGKQPGDTVIHLGGLLGGSPSAAVTVSDVLVAASALVARVVTAAAWESGGQPPSQYTYGMVVSAGVVVSNLMTAEGDSGSMFTRVVWSDGTTQDVGNAPVVGVEELSLAVGSSNVATTAPSASDPLWRVSVALGAVAECVDSVMATWKVCGADVVGGMVPLFLDLPDPRSASLVIAQGRLTSPSDDASRPPIGVPTSSQLTVHVTFDDGNVRDLSTDDRVSYSVLDTTCVAVAPGSATIVLRVVSGATCTSVGVVATVRLGSAIFFANHTRPLVYVASMKVSFGGYPDEGANRNLAVTTLGLMPCSASVYFHATAQVRVHLTDTSSSDVTSQSRFVSSAPEVIYLSSTSSTRMQALSAGSATVSASFGSNTTARAVLGVQNMTLDAASSLTWNVPTVDSNNLEAGAYVWTQVQLTYMSGLVHRDLASSSYASWISIGALISFSSSQAAAMAISSEGRLALQDNYHVAVDLGASVSCSSSVSTSLSRYANLKALPMDADFGSLSGMQFPHTPGASYLDVAVHVRPAADTKLKAFQIKLGPLSPVALNSAAGASWTDSGTFSGIATQFDNPSTEVVLSASDTASTVSTLITLGTVRLNVVGAGVHLIEGELVTIVVQTASGTDSELQYVAAVAGQGYVNLQLSRRRALDAGPLTAARQLPQLRWEPARHRLQGCEPCSSQVWGDFNGDCQFLASDVLALSTFVLARAAFEDGSITQDPLLSYTASNGADCDFLRQQANPSLDLMYQAGSNAADARYGRPAITALDSLHLLYATVKKHRFLSVMMASCVNSSASGVSSQDLHVVLELKGGDGQNAATVNADPAFTDVFFEVRVSPARIPLALEVSQACPLYLHSLLTTNYLTLPIPQTCLLYLHSLLTTHYSPRAHSPRRRCPPRCPLVGTAAVSLSKRAIQAAGGGKQGYSHRRVAPRGA